MKKILLLLIALCAAMIQLKAQNGSLIVDGAVTGSGVNQFNYIGAGWVRATNTSDPYRDATVSYSNQTGNYVTFNFQGNKISLFSAKASHHGIIAVSIDGGQETLVDLYSGIRVNYFSAYTSPTLGEGSHTLKIRATGTKNAASSNTYAIVDYVEIVSGTNFALGPLALKSNTIGKFNLAIGIEALTSNTVGYDNVAIGYQSLYTNTATLAPAPNFTKGHSNTAVGNQSLFSNNDGDGNVAIGLSTLRSNVDGYLNTAVGLRSLYSNTTGYYNIAVGSGSMYGNSSGYGNTAIGLNSLGGNGNYNCVMGINALQFNNSGSLNVVIGSGSLNNNGNGDYNTVIGCEAAQFHTGLSNSTAIGYRAFFTASNQMRFGNEQVTSIGGAVSWSTLSDGRVKKDIKEDVSGLAFIEKLRPVSYVIDQNEVNKLLRIPDSLQNKAALRQKPVRQIGFVAQEVEAVVKKTGYTFSGVETPKNESDHYSIRYAEFVVPLVKGMQELSATVKEQKDEIAQLKQQLRSYDSINGVQGNDKVTAVLYQNTPNPFSADTEIRMTVPDDALNAVVKIYNLEGRQLKSVLVKERGTAKINVSANELHAGMYLYTLIIDGKPIDTKRMILTE